MQSIKRYDYLFNEDEVNSRSLKHKILPLTFIRDVKFFFDISYDDVNKLLIEVEKIKEAKKLKAKKCCNKNVLTLKEKQVFDLVVSGLTTKKISEKLFVQPGTISTHRKNIKQKLQFENTFDWFEFAALNP